MSPMDEERRIRDAERHLHRVHLAGDGLVVDLDGLAVVERLDVDAPHRRRLDRGLRRAAAPGDRQQGEGEDRSHG